MSRISFRVFMSKLFSYLTSFSEYCVRKSGLAFLHAT